MAEISRRLLAGAGLSREAMAAALNIAGLRPDPAEWRGFAARAMRFAGVLSLAAGMIFLVAFDWQDLGVYGRFATVEIPILAALVFAWFKGAGIKGARIDGTPIEGARTEGDDRLSGKLSLMLAVLLTGALLALFGQTYQTGADVYELFLGWAALSLPWVIACRYAPCWAVWLLLTNATAGLYAATAGRGWLISLLMDRWQWSPWSLPFLLDLLLYVTLVSLSRWKELGLGEGWLRRGVMAAAMMFGTLAMIYRIAGGRHSPDDSGAAIALEVLLYLAASAAFAVHTYSQKEDLFNFAVLALSWIVVTATLIGRAMIEDNAGIGTLFIIALYVIVTSTGAVKSISYLGSQWKVEGTAR